MGLFSVQAEAFRKVHPLLYYQKFLARGVRPDGRALLGARQTSAQSRVVTTANGSAMVKLGQTSVVVGVQVPYTLDARPSRDCH